MQSGVPLGTALPLITRALIEVPDLCRSVTRGIYKKHISSVLDYHFRKDGSSSSLWVMSFRITNLCNHRCAVCAQWGSQGYNFTRPNSEITENLPLETYTRVIDETAHLKPHIYITGGEPFLYRHLVPFVNHIKRHNLSVQIVTNGVLLEKTAEQIVDNQWDVICASIDGTREVHDRCRGLAGAYDTLVRGVGRLQEVKRKRGLPKPYIIPIATVSEKNAHVLVESIEEARKFKPDGMVVYYSWFTTEEVGRQHVAAMEGLLGCTPKAWKGYVMEKNAIDTEALAKSVRRIRSSEYGFPILFVPNLDLEAIPKYFTEPEEMFGYSHCVAPWFMVDIMPNGDVVTCRDHPDYVVGNITKDSLVSIYNNDRYKAFRNALRSRENGLFPICARCCGLMGY